MSNDKGGGGCPAITAAGQPCKGYVHPGHSWCPAHDPSRVEARKRAASKAGRSRSGSEIGEVKAQLRQLANDCLGGSVERGTASVTAQVLGVWLKAAEVEIREREAVVKERELSEIRIPEFQRLEQEVQELRELVEQKDTSVTGRRSWAG